jgi:hypothetical protein
MIPGLDPDTARRLVDAYREARFSGTPEGRKRADEILAEIRAGRYLKPIDWEALVAEERKRLYPDEASPPAQPPEPEPPMYRSILGAEDLTPPPARPDTDLASPSVTGAPSPTPRPIPARVSERATPAAEVLRDARREIARRRIAPSRPERRAPQRRAPLVAPQVAPLPRLQLRIRPELISGAERFPMVWRKPRE